MMSWPIALLGILAGFAFAVWNIFLFLRWCLRMSANDPSARKNNRHYHKGD